VSYQVFARKYRPKSFADVLGQDHVVRTLRNAIAKNRLAHAYLFVGPRGTGKTSTARIFAKALNCPGGPSVDFDPEDPVCREIAEGRCLDVREIDGASNNGVEQVRELRDNVNYAPASCRFKIYYIDEVHMLSTAAFNALLKTLEEPPEHVKFIFATTEANKILPTIISRCQRFDLRRIPDPIIANHLLHIAKEEGVELEEKAAYAIARGADGGMRDAQSMLDQLVAFCGEKVVESDVLEVFGFTALEAVANLAHSILQRDTVGALRAVNQQSEAGKDLGRFLADLIQHTRTLLVCQSDSEALGEEMSPEMAEVVRAQAAMAKTEQLLRIVDGLADVDARMRWTSNKRLHLELGVIQAIEGMAEVSLSDVINAIDKAGGSAGEAAALVQARRASVGVDGPRVAVVTAPIALADAVRQAPAVEVASPAITLALEEPEQQAPPQRKIVSVEEGWQSILPVLQTQRPLIANWARLGVQLSFERGVMTIGFPPSEANGKNSLMREPTRVYLEQLVSEAIQQRVKLEMILDDTLSVPEVILQPEPDDVPNSPTAPVVAEMPVGETTAPAPTGRSADEEFQDDPLIDAVVEQLGARLIEKGRPSK
jgi:DNA polymerase III subunit gamma/tau